MLQLHTNLNYQSLYPHLLHLLEQEQSLFAKPQIVIPNHSTKLWLQQSLASDLGVCSQIDFLMPLEFLWQQSQSHYKNPKDFNPFQKNVLCWYLFEQIQQGKISALTKWQSRTELQQWTAAQKLSATLIRYIQEQPKELLDWQKKPQHWQAFCWKQLLKDLNLESPIDVLASLKASLQPPKNSNLVVFFAVEQLTEYQFEFIQTLAVFQNLHFMISNPCPEIFWFDNRSAASIERTRHFHPELAQHLDVGHPLLSSLGQNKMALFNALFDSEMIEVSDFNSLEFEFDNKKPTLLQSLQQDIFHLNSAPQICKADKSLSIHSCHNTMRQVEVIKDEILHLLNKDSTLQCHEIIVVAPDINDFKEAIHLVFNENHASSPPSFYYHIDRMQLDDSICVEGVLALLQSFTEDMTSKNMFKLLSHEAIYQPLGLKTDDLAIIKTWLQNSNVRSFYSKYHRHQQGFEAQTCNTFEFGEQRWISGFLAGDVDDTEFASVFADLAGSETLFNAVFEFFSNWFYAYESLNKKSRTAKKWSELFEKICSKFIADDEQKQSIFDVIDTVLVKYTQDSKASISLILALQIVTEALQNQSFRPFGRMGVRFQSWENAFIAPAKVLILLGLDETVFPKSEPSNDFDLFKNQHHGLRRQINGRDRNLLLSALTESHEKLIITYNGFDNKTNEPLPPSPLLRELIEHLCEKTAGDFHVQQHQLQDFHPEYFAADNTTNSFNQQALNRLNQARNRTFKRKIFEPLPEPDIDSVSEPKKPKFEQLQQFFKDPLTYFLHKNAQISLDIQSDSLSEFESYSAQGLEHWKLKSLCFHESAAHAIKQGLLMTNTQGRAEIHNINQSIVPLKLIKSELQKNKLTTSTNALELTGEFWLNNKQQIQSFSLSEYNSSLKSICEHWVTHVFFSPEKHSHLHCLHGGVIEFLPIEDSQFLQNLQTDLIQIWQHCQNQPWVFLPPASFRFIRGKASLQDFENYQKHFRGSEQNPVKNTQKYFISWLQEDSFLNHQHKFIQPLLDHIEVKK